MTQASPVFLAAAPVASTGTTHETASVVRHLAHELRQPLSTIESIAYYLQLVLPSSEEKALKHVHKLQELVMQANNSLADAVHFLQASPPRPLVQDLNELVAQCFKPESDTESGLFSLDLAEDLPPVWLDRWQGEHLLHRLAAAGAYIHRGSFPLHVRTFSKNREVHLDVYCPGACLSSQEILAMLQPFCNQEEPCGSGLALASARRIAEAHGGTLCVQSGPLGISLRVTLPAA